MPPPVDLNRVLGPGTARFVSFWGLRSAGVEKIAFSLTKVAS